VTPPVAVSENTAALPPVLKPPLVMMPAATTDAAVALPVVDNAPAHSADP
jgi:hypothetical protein